LHHLTIHPQPAIASGEQLAWVLRNPSQLKQLLNEFIAAASAESSFGNTLVRRLNTTSTVSSR
jgi:hypothetical protein